MLTQPALQGRRAVSTCCYKLWLWDGMTNGPIRAKQVNQWSSVIGHIDELASTTCWWKPGRVTGRGEFTFHIWIFGPSEVCAVSWGKLTFFLYSGSECNLCIFYISYCQAQPKFITTSLSQYKISVHESRQFVQQPGPSKMRALGTITWFDLQPST